MNHKNHELSGQVGTYLADVRNVRLRGERRRRENGPVQCGHREGGDGTGSVSHVVLQPIAVPLHFPARDRRDARGLFYWRRCVLSRVVLEDGPGGKPV